MQKVRIRDRALAILINRKLRRVVRIYQEQKRLLIKELKLINRIRRNPRTTQATKVDLYFQRKMYVLDFRQHLIITAFLMFYSYVEEALLLMTQPTACAHASRKTGIDRAKEIFLKTEGLNLSEFPRWQVLKDFAKIRHLILHANANVHLVKDADGIEALLNRRRNFLYVSRGQLRLREAVLPYFEGLLDDFIVWIVSRKQRHGTLQSVL